MERHAAGVRPLSQFSETWVRQMAHGAGQAPAYIGWWLWAGFAGLTAVAALVLQSSV
jgi:hypothetical protein